MSIYEVKLLSPDSEDEGRNHPTIISGTNLENQQNISVAILENHPSISYHHWNQQWYPPRNQQPTSSAINLDNHSIISDMNLENHSTISVKNLETIQQP